MASRLKSLLWLWYSSFVLAVAFVVGTDLVPSWGNWYSPNLAYREQTEAFLHGSFALHTTPTALRNDLAWHDGGVQQVWGLGVPLWRFPFELFAKLCGQFAFPDRLAFGAAVMLLAFFALRVFLNSPDSANESIRDYLGKPCRVVVSLALLFFPPFVVLCYYRFDVYEEAVAYAYLYGIGLFLTAVAFGRRPGKGHYLFACALAGAAPFVRPTLGAYSVTTFCLLVWHARRAHFKWKVLLCGSCLFLSGGFLLFLTNLVRFGSGFEFGHSLNFNGFPIWFFDRIYNPFQKEPLPSAARELFGATFCRPILNVFDWNRQGVFWGQSLTPRWRHFYISCFDPSFLLFLLLGWCIWLWSLIPRKRRSYVLPVEVSIAGYWSLVSVVLLSAFYLRAPVISNRYVFDFAPAFAAAVVGCLLGVERLIHSKRHWVVVVIIGMTAWLGLEFDFGKSKVGRSNPIDKAAVIELLHRDYPNPKPLPSAYEVGEDLTEYGIPYNGAGWNAGGAMDAMAVLFVNNPDYLQINVAPVDTVRKIDYSSIQAKIGLAFLSVESVNQSGSNCVIRFRMPKQPTYRRGVQVVFLAYVDKTNLSAEQSPLRLLKVQWGD